MKFFIVLIFIIILIISSIIRKRNIENFATHFYKQKCDNTDTGPRIDEYPLDSSPICQSGLIGGLASDTRFL